MNDWKRILRVLFPEQFIKKCLHMEQSDLVARATLFETSALLRASMSDFSEQHYNTEELLAGHINSNQAI